MTGTPIFTQLVEEFHQAGKDIIGSLHYTPTSHEVMIANSKANRIRKVAVAQRKRRKR